MQTACSSDKNGNSGFGTTSPVSVSTKTVAADCAGVVECAPQFQSRGNTTFFRPFVVSTEIAAIRSNGTSSIAVLANSITDLSVGVVLAVLAEQSAMQRRSEAEILFMAGMFDFSSEP